MAGTTSIATSHGPIKAIHIQVPVGIPTADGGLEIPNRIFLGGIPTETTELELELFFSEFGLVKDVRIVTDRITGESKGYGFVTFEDTEDISSMLRKKTINMKGKKLRIRKAVRRNGSQFQPSDSGISSADSSDALSPVSNTSASPLHRKTNEVFFVPQGPIQQELPPIGNYHSIPIQHTQVPMQMHNGHGPVHNGHGPVTSPLAYQQQMAPSFPQVYCYPVCSGQSVNYAPPQSYISQPYYGVPVYSQI